LFSVFGFCFLSLHRIKPDTRAAVYEKLNIGVHLKVRILLWNKGRIKAMQET
jgi:hypothetical protein